VDQPRDTRSAGHGNQIIQPVLPRFPHVQPQQVQGRRIETDQTTAIEVSHDQGVVRHLEQTPRHVTGD